MASTAADKRWIELEVAAWRGNVYKTNGLKVVESAARKKWQKFSAEQRNGVSLHIQQYQTAAAVAVTTQDALGPLPAKTDVSGLTAVGRRLDAAIAARRTACTTLNALIVSRQGLPDTEERTVRYLQQLRRHVKASLTSFRQVRNSVALALERARPTASQVGYEQQYGASSDKNAKEEPAAHNKLAPPPPLTSAAPVAGQDFEVGEHIRTAQGLLKHGWVGPVRISQESQQSCSVYIKQNSCGIITDRVVIKDGWAGQNETTMFYDGDGKRTPVEVAAMEKLTDIAGSESIVNLRNWRSYPADHPSGLEYRIYMEYCGEGDLWSLIQHYYQFRHRAVNTPPDQALWLPEPFLWAVLESLVAGGLLMQSGDEGPAWYQIVHCDLKLANVFLGKSSDKTYCGYPQPKIGDFGASLMLAPQSHYPPKQLFRDDNVGIGTENARPPEQIKGIADEKGVMPGASSNVWGVGFVMWSLIKGADVDAFLKDFEDIVDMGGDRSPGQGRTPARFSNAAKQNYSFDLRKTVEHCLQYDAGKRPSFQDLVDVILKNTGEGKYDRARGLRLADASNNKFARYGILSKRDDWPLRTCLLAGPGARELPGADDPPLRKARRNCEDFRSESESEDESDDDLGGGERGEILVTREQVEADLRRSKRPSPDRDTQGSSSSKRARTSDDQQSSSGYSSLPSPSSPPSLSSSDG